MIILRPEALLQEKMAVCGLPRVPHHQEHVHVILAHQRRPIGAAKTIQNKIDLFAYFIDENMLTHVVKHTNERARKDHRKRSKNPDGWMPFDLCEMKDSVGVLYLIGVYRCQHESFHSLWSPAPSERAIFFASNNQKTNCNCFIVFHSFCVKF